MVDVKCEWQEPASLGEGPLWVERDNAVYWVDILEKRVHRLRLGDGNRRSWTFEAQITSLAARRQGGFVASVRDGFAFVDLDQATLVDESRVEPIALPEAHLPGNRFNDGKVDAHGRYWAGSMDDGHGAESGVLYRLDPDLSLHTMDTGYIITNGPTFSPDGTTLYHTDTVKRVIYAFDFDDSGTIRGKRVFAELRSEEEGQPDGMTVDSEGCIWLCHFGGTRLTRYSPAGEVLSVIPMPVPNVTSCTFAGPGLETLYITTARVGLDDEQLRRSPLAGSLFSCRPGVTGLPTPLFGEHELIR